jgi:hypothetical protein
MATAPYLKAQSWVSPSAGFKPQDPYLEELLAADNDELPASVAIPRKRESMGEAVTRGEGPSGAVITDFAQVVFENLKTAGVQNTKKGERLMLENLRGFASRTGMIQFQGEYTEKGTRKRAAVSIGPEYDTVGYDLVRRAAKEAVDLFDMLIVCGFAFAPEVDDTRLNFGDLTVLKARMNQDLRMADKLKATGAGNLFVVFGESPTSRSSRCRAICCRRKSVAWIFSIRPLARSAHPAARNC